jgi:hypothetical protein
MARSWKSNPNTFLHLIKSGITSLVWSIDFSRVHLPHQTSHTNKTPLLFFKPIIVYHSWNRKKIFSYFEFQTKRILLTKILASFFSLSFCWNRCVSFISATCELLSLSSQHIVFHLEIQQLFVNWTDISREMLDIFDKCLGQNISHPFFFFWWKATLDLVQLCKRTCILLELFRGLKKKRDRVRAFVLFIILVD